ncbi:MAG TPA: hypothetical protein VFE62_02310 [Gemmataceae bacterium]|nr:hypothetical protein [Gemmataceae bacterium]
MASWKLCARSDSHDARSECHRPLYLSPICLRKVCWNLQLEPVPYLTRLKAFCQANGLDPEGGWYERPIAALKSWR